MGLDVIAAFPKPNDGGEAAARFLTTLGGGPGASDLVGLPKVDPLLAYAAKGDGVRNAQMARTLVKIILNKALDVHVLLNDEDRKKFYSDFDAMYQHLKGSRLVMYRTPADKFIALGSIAAVGILDIDDPEAHLAGWKGLADFANALGVKLVKGGRESAPKFMYQERAESIDGLRVDHLGIEIATLPEEVRNQYRCLLGPDWNKVRLVVEGRHIVFLVGSDVVRLKETLTNLKTGAKGLAEEKSIAAALGQLAPERKLEFHASVKDYAGIHEEQGAANRRRVDVVGTVR